MAAAHFLRWPTGWPPARSRAFAAAAICLGLGLLAIGARTLAHPWLGDGLPFVFAFPAVVACTLWGGLVGGLAATLGGAAWHLFLGAGSSGVDAVLQASVFMAAGSVVAVLVATLSRRGQRDPGAAEEDGHARRDAATLFWLRAGILLSVAVPWAVFAALALYTHASAVQSAERRMDRLAAIAHEHALKLFETTDLLIREVNQQTQSLDTDRLVAQQDALSAQLAGLVQGLSQVHSVWILDRRGFGMVSSRVPHLDAPRDFSARPVFLEHRARPGPVVLTPPRLGTVTQEVFFDVSRARIGADGRFNGVTTVGLYPSYFTTFYRELADSEKGVILALVQPDGRVVARWPQLDGPMQLPSGTPLLVQMRQGSPRGHTNGTSSPSGLTRFGSFRQVGKFPAYVYAGTDEASALAGWRHDLMVLAAFILPLSLALSLISWHALRRTTRHIEAARQLRAEAFERERVEAALRQSQKLEAMGHLTGGVAHDFNNLLMVVNLNVTLLRQRLRDGTHDRQIDAIERSVAAGKKLTRQLLAFSRRQPLLPQVIDLQQQLPTLLDLIRPALGGRIELSGDVAPGTRAVRLDSAELELALINLAVNARDAMPDGGSVRIHARDVEGGLVELAFGDTGSGIAPEDLERVFEPFFTTKPLGYGTGLGLAQVYGLCARAGGSARVDSTVGQGTTVLLRFPGIEVGDGDVPRPQAPASRIEQLGLRVLLVEDNTDIASATREVLEAAGCEVVHVPQATLVAEALAQGPRVNIVLSDIVMPGGMDGLQLCEQLHLTHPRLPVVLITGYAEKLGEAEAQGLVVLPKPFEPALLLRVLRERMHVGERDGIVRLQD